MSVLTRTTQPESSSKGAFHGPADTSDTILHLPVQQKANFEDLLKANAVVRFCKLRLGIDAAVPPRPKHRFLTPRARRVCSNYVRVDTPFLCGLSDPYDPLAITEAIGLDSHLGEHPQIEVAQRSFFGKLQVCCLADSACCCTTEQDR